MEEIVFPNQIRINRKMRGVSMQDLPTGLASAFRHFQNRKRIQKA